MKVTLYCVGCGEPVCQAEPGTVLAITCWYCDADSPILRGDDGSFAPPVSLVSIVQRSTDPSARLNRQGASIPHLEYYLGYSDHESAVKNAIIQALRELGSISQAECPEKGCQTAYERGRERCQRSRQEREERELQEQERHYRIMEIGEP